MHPSVSFFDLVLVSHWSWVLQEANEDHPETLWEPPSMPSALSLQLWWQSCSFAFRRDPDQRTAEDWEKGTVFQFQVVSSCWSLPEISRLVLLAASQLLARVLQANKGAAASSLIWKHRCFCSLVHFFCSGWMIVKAADTVKALRNIQVILFSSV